jgi:hypothetical protein
MQNIEVPIEIQKETTIVQMTLVSKSSLQQKLFLGRNKLRMNGQDDARWGEIHGQAIHFQPV